MALFFKLVFWALNRRRGDAHKPDRKTGRLDNTAQQGSEILLSCPSFSNPGREPLGYHPSIFIISKRMVKKAGPMLQDPADTSSRNLGPIFLTISVDVCVLLLTFFFLRLIRNGAPTSILWPPKRISGAAVAAAADDVGPRLLHFRCLPEFSSDCSISPPSRVELKKVGKRQELIKREDRCTKISHLYLL